MQTTVRGHHGKSFCTPISPHWIIVLDLVKTQTLFRCLLPHEHWNSPHKQAALTLHQSRIAGENGDVTTTIADPDRPALT
jgi:hypothetical protein